jgi:hypothetical protein
MNYEVIFRFIFFRLTVYRHNLDALLKFYAKPLFIVNSRVLLCL